LGPGRHRGRGLLGEVSGSGPATPRVQKRSPKRSAQTGRRRIPRRRVGEVAKNGGHEVGAGVPRAPNRGADAHDADGLAAALERLLASLIHDEGLCRAPRNAVRAAGPTFVHAGDATRMPSCFAAFAIRTS
jgi:hypothetical protein